MALVEPTLFDNKDLFLNVRLSARIDGKLYDYLGKRTFDISFFREGVSFGITNIEIDVNTSFQPVVKITFKDLYGSTTMMQGTEKSADRANKKKIEESEDNKIDYSQLFRWPPPKFNFTFKGFLGRQVTWILNLKQYSIAYNSGDASNTIVAEFVPNQFGFLADIPFLYLKSVKKLREQFNDPEDRLTVFEILEIGKKVEETTRSVDKTYESDIEILGLLNSGPSIALSQEMVEAGKDVNVTYKDTPNNNDGDIIKDFQIIKIPEKIGGDTLDREFINSNINGAKENDFNLWIRSNSFIGGDQLEGGGGLSFEDFLEKLKDTDFRNQVNTSSDKFLAAVSKNQDLVDDVKSAQVFVGTESKIGELTISNVLAAIARDASYLMGAILDAGNNGFSHFEDVRKAADAELIGLHYPMTVDEGFEVPASQGFGINITNEDDNSSNEMVFVNAFIASITDAISRESASQSLTFPSQKPRMSGPITNFEILRPNPYAPTRTNIATNMLLRSGIAVWHAGGSHRNDLSARGHDLNPNDIQELAAIDFENIKPVLAKLYSSSPHQFQSLKVFSDFFRKVFTNDGSAFSDAVDFGENETPSLDVESPDVFKIDEYRKASISGLNDTETQTLGDMLDSTLNDISKYGVDPSTMFGEYVVVNGLHYINPRLASVIEDNDISANRYLVFFGKDAEDILAVAGSDPERGGAFEIKYEAGANTKVLGIEFFASEVDANLSDEVVDLNKSIKRKDVYQWDKIRNDISPSGVNGQLLPSDFDTAKFTTTFRALENESSESSSATYNVYLNSNAQRRVAAIKFQDLNGISDTYMGTMFNLFSNIGKSKMQRVFVSEISRLVFTEMNRFESDKIKERSNLINKFSNATNDIYKQFHVLYQNWSTLSIDQENIEGEVRPNGDSSYRNSMSSEFGDNHVDYRDTAQRNGLPERTSTAFVYQYPLQSISDGLASDVDIRDAIVNVDPIRTGFNDAKTTVLNVIQNICTKNNFTFIPVPGNPHYSSTKDIYQPQDIEPQVDFLNTFHVMFLPTPESRANLSNTYQSRIVQKPEHASTSTNGIIVRYGSAENQIVTSVDVDTEDNKVTAESIINLQALVDSSSENKRVTRDCSMLPVLAGRSYKSTVNMLGNAQVFPSQFYFLDRSPLFGGLYQIMRVSHTITPNNMETSLEGIRMRFSNGGYGAVEPITTQTYRDLVNNFNLDSIPNLDQQTAPQEIVNETKGERDNEIEVKTTNTDFEEFQEDIVQSSGGLIIDRGKKLQSNQYFQRKTNKRMLFLHHTAGSPRAESSIDWWNSDDGNIRRNKVATSYVIGRDDDNKVFECFDPEYYAYHVGISDASNKTFQENSIGIELCAYGPLTYEDGLYKTVYNSVIPEDEVAILGRPFKGNKYFHRYSDTQLQSLEKLMEYLIEKFNIPIQNSFSMDWFEYNSNTVRTAPNGIHSHAAVRRDKTDVYPDTRILSMLRRLGQKYNNIT